MASAEMIPMSRAVHPDPVSGESFPSHRFAPRPRRRTSRTAPIHPAGVSRVTPPMRVYDVVNGPRSTTRRGCRSFPLREGVEKHRHGADVHGEGAQSEHVRRNTGQFAADHADELAACREVGFDPKEFSTASA